MGEVLSSAEEASNFHFDLMFCLIEHGMPRGGHDFQLRVWDVGCEEPCVDRWDVDVGDACYDQGWRDDCGKAGPCARS